MKHKKTLWIVALSLLITPSPATLIHGSYEVAPQTNKQTTSTEQQKNAFKTFSKRVKAYVAHRNQVKNKLPALSKEATPEEIKAYQESFANALRAARANAKPGDLFEKTIADHIRVLIKDEFKGSDRVELKKTVLEADTKGVPLRINYPYPEAKEFAQVPPTLLLKLPELPKEVKYRFVNYHMLLVDTDNDLIIDYMLKALP